jgi:class 3 adenylate cyclase
MLDLRGYTRLAADADPTLVVQFLNGYLARMTDIVIAYGGTVNEFIGDAIFAIFGAPLAYADHAQRAAACAIAMQTAMTEVNRLHEARGLPHLEMGIGLNTGEAVVGNIGSEKRAKYGVVGNAVNVAARVEGCTVGGQILLSPFTYARIREIADVGPPVAVELKGIQKPLLLYELPGLAGPYNQRIPQTATGHGEDLPTTLPLRCWVIEDKAIRAEAVTGQVFRLGPRWLAARRDTRLTPLLDVRLRLSYPALAQDSADLYGKVLTVEGQGDVWLTRIELTSLGAADQQILEGLQRGKGSDEA